MFDILFLIALVYFAYRGYNKGIVIALFAFVGILIATVAATKLSGSLAVYLFKDGVHQNRALSILAYLLVFFAVLWLIKLVANLLERSLKSLSLGWVNRLSGALLYGLLVSFAGSSFLWLLDWLHLLSDGFKSSSIVYTYVQPMAPLGFELIGKVFPFVKSMAEQLSQGLDALNHQIAYVGFNR